MTRTEQLLEVHLEEWGQRSWLTAMANTLAGTYGSAQFRFVARPAGDGSEPIGDGVVGATFPVMRFQDLNDLHEPNAWIDIARERLDELDARLGAQGWIRLDKPGRHWWSRTYIR